MSYPNDSRPMGYRVQVAGVYLDFSKLQTDGLHYDSASMDEMLSAYSVAVAGRIAVDRALTKKSDGSPGYVMKIPVGATEK